jgi:Dolichyl-phosphate-mannose-protein mannosyltransferase
VVIVTAAALAALAAVWIRTGAVPTAYAGPRLVVRHVEDLAAVALLFLGFTGLGEAVLRMAADAGAPAGSTCLQRLVFATCTGAALAGGVAFLSGLVFGFGPAALLVTWGALAVAAIRVLPAALGLLAGAAREARPRIHPAVLALGGVALLFMLVNAVAPPTDFDALTYHVAVPRGLLRHGGFHYPQLNPHAALIGPLHILFVPFLAAGSVAGPALVQVGFTALLALAVFALCDRFLDRWTANLATAALWGSPILLLVGMTPRIDVALALYLLLVQYALLLAADGSSPWALALAGLWAGFAVGIKYHALVFLACLLPLAAVALRRRPARPGWKPALWGAAGFVFLAGPFLLKNLMLFSDPVFPLLAAPAVPPWAATLAAPGAVPAMPGALALVGRYVARFDVVGWFLHPARLTPEAEGFLYRANLLFLAAPLCLFGRRRLCAWLVLPALAYGAIVIAAQPATNLRYLIPLAAPLTIAAAEGIGAVTRGLRGRARRAVAGVALAVGLAATAFAITAELARRDQLLYAGGAMSQRRYLQDELPPGLAAVTRDADALPPAAGPVLMLFESRVFYFRRPVIPDNNLVNWATLETLLSPGGCLPARVAPYVVINWGTLDWVVQRVPSAVAQRQRLRAFAAKCLRQIGAEAEYGLYRTAGVPSGGR